MWRGVVWCGVVWSGVVWRGGVVWCGVVSCDVVRCGDVWRGVARHVALQDSHTRVPRERGPTREGLGSPGCIRGNLSDSIGGGVRSTISG